MNATNETTVCQYRLDRPFYVWRIDSESFRTFLGVVYAMGEWGAVTAAQEQFGLRAHYAVKASKYGKNVASTW